MDALAKDAFDCQSECHCTKTGSHAAKPFVPAATVEEALEFAAEEFGVDKMGTMYKEIGIDGANLINSAIYAVKSSLGDVKLRDIRYKATINGNKSVIAAYNPAWNGLYFSRAVKGKNAAAKLRSMSKEQFDIGWWSSGSPVGVINHEMGHYAHFRLDDAWKPTVCEHYLGALLEEFRKEAAGDAKVDWNRWGSAGGIAPDVVSSAKRMGLSGYAMVNTHELVAECLAQLYDGSVSDAAKKVLKTLLEYAGNVEKPENALIKRKLERL